MVYHGIRKCLTCLCFRHSREAHDRGLDDPSHQQVSWKKCYLSHTHFVMIGKFWQCELSSCDWSDELVITGGQSQKATNPLSKVSVGSCAFLELFLVVIVYILPSGLCQDVFSKSFIGNIFQEIPHQTHDIIPSNPCEQVFTWGPFQELYLSPWSLPLVILSCTEITQ